MPQMSRIFRRVRVSSENVRRLRMRVTNLSILLLAALTLLEAVPDRARAQSVVTPPSTAFAGPFIWNGGFELGALTYWSTTGTFDGGVTSAEAHTGGYSLEMGSMDFVQQSLTTKRSGPGRRLEFWAKASEPILTGPAYATVSYADGTSTSRMFGGTSLASGDWTHFQMVLHRRKDVVEVEFSVGESSPIYVDDVVLTR